MLPAPLVVGGTMLEPAVVVPMPTGPGGTVPKEQAEKEEEADGGNEEEEAGGAEAADPEPGTDPADADPDPG